MDFLALLPSSLLLHVLEFAAAEECAFSKFVPCSPASVQLCLPQVALVSRSWRRAVDELESERQSRIHCVTLREPAQEAQWLETHVYDRVAEKGDTLRELRVDIMGDRKLGGGLFEMRAELKRLQAVESLAIDWHRVFASCRKLQRLDLSGAPLNSARILGSILDAASSHCPRLQALVLPAIGMGVTDRQVDPAPVMSDLYRALERWFVHGLNGGLTQLTVPKRHTFTDSDESLQQSSNRYLTAVAQYCPSIAYLDGWKCSYSGTTELRCTEAWFCSLDAWRTFSQSCTKIREFNWFAAPFDRDYLAAFGAYVKPNLTKMTITCGNDEYFSDALLSGEYYRAGGFSFSSECLDHVLSACPALQDLTVVFSKLLYRTQWLQERITDSFLCALGTYCSELKRLTIEEIETVSQDDAIPNISDVGLSSLARLPQLRNITMKQTGCSAEGILSLILYDPSPRDTRYIRMKVGSADLVHHVHFYDVLLDLMNQMIARPAPDLLGRRFHLELVARGTSQLANKETVRSQAAAAVKALAVRHPSVEVSFCTHKKKALRKIPADLSKAVSIVFKSE